MFRILFAVGFLLGASGSSVDDNVEILLTLASSSLSTFKAELEAEDAKKAVQGFEETVKTDASLHQAEVLLKEVSSNAELKAKVQAMIQKLDSIIPQAEADRAALIADILDEKKGKETMKRLLGRLS
uniref:Uncharacterized protein n=1 Tax=Lygus hesperus TaxID=30085 RepID=A0A0K8SKA8_LYGHE